MVSQEALPAAAEPRTAVPEASGDDPQATGAPQATVAGVSAAPASAAPADAGCSMFAPAAHPAPAAAGTMQPQSASGAPEQARPGLPAAPMNAAAQVCGASMERYPMPPRTVPPSTAALRQLAPLFALCFCACSSCLGSLGSAARQCNFDQASTLPDLPQASPAALLAPVGLHQQQPGHEQHVSQQAQHQPQQEQLEQQPAQQAQAPMSQPPLSQPAGEAAAAPQAAQAAAAQALPAALAAVLAAHPGPQTQAAPSLLAASAAATAASVAAHGIVELPDGLPGASSGAGPKYKRGRGRSFFKGGLLSPLQWLCVHALMWGGCLV